MTTSAPRSASLRALSELGSRVRARAAKPYADLAVQWQVVDAFLAAAREGDFEALIRVLDSNVVLRVDGGPHAPPAFARRPIFGAASVAREATSFQDVGVRLEAVIVNGAPGLFIRFPARSILGAFTVANGRIVEIDLIADPDKLRGLPLE